MLIDKRGVFYKNKFLFLLMLIILSSVAVYIVFSDSGVLNVIQVELNSPTSNSWDNDGIVNFTCTPTLNSTQNNSISNLTLWANFTGTWATNISNTSAVTNNTPYNLTVSGIPDGVYIWNCMAFNNDTSLRDNATASSNFTIYVDKTTPLLQLLSPGNYTYSNTQSVTLRYNASDASLQSCVLFENSTGAMKLNTTNSSLLNTSTNYVNITLSFASDGVYAWNVTCNDSAVNNAITSGAFLVYVDSIAPTVNLVNPANNSISNSKTVTLRYNATDTNLQSCVLYENSTGTMKVNTTNTSLLNGSQNYVNITLTFGADGIYAWNVTCNDSLSWNGTTSGSYIINIDSETPTVAIIDPAQNGTYIFNSTITFMVNDTPRTGTGINYTFYLNNTAFTNGTNATNGTVMYAALNSALLNDGGLYTLIINATDNASNIGTSPHRTFYWDSAAPILFNPNPVNNTYIPNLSNSIFLVNVTEQNLDLSTNVTMYYRRTGSYSSKIMNCSGTAPNWICYANIDLTNPSIVSDNETLQYFFNMTDLANRTGFNGTQAAPLVALVDITTPVLAITSPVDGIVDNDGTLTFNYSINETNKHTCLLLLSNSSNLSIQTTQQDTGLTTYNFTNTSLPQGNYTWLVGCNDSAGHYVNSSESRTFMVDTTAPSVNLLTPVNDSWSTTNTITLRYNSSDPYLQSCRLYENSTGIMKINTTNSSLSGSYFNFINNTLTFGADGVYAWNVTCNDTAGNEGRASGSFLIKTDTVIPSIAITSPADGIIDNDGTLTFNYSINETNKHTCLLFLSNSSNISIQITQQDTGLATYNFTNVSLPQGNYTWLVGCNDSAGNYVNSTNNWTFMVDTTAPSVNLLTPVNDSWSTTNTITLRYNSSDPYLQSCRLYENSTGIMKINTTNSSLSGSYFNFINNTLTFGADGVYAWNVTCNDTAGNEGRASGSFLISTDTINPNLYNSSIVNNTWITNTLAATFTINLNEVNINLSKNISLFYRRVGSYVERNLSCSGSSPNYMCTGTYDISSLVTDGETLQYFYNTTDNSGRTAWNGTQAAPLVATVDTTNPVAGVVTGNKTFFNTNTPTISINATDNIDTYIDYIVYIDSAINTAGSITAGTIYANITLAAIANNGSHTLIIQANDSAGNKANSSIFTIYIDNANPVPSMTTGNKSFFLTTTPTISLLLVDDSASLNTTINYTIFVDGTADKTGSLFNNSGGSDALSAVTLGSHLIIIQATDNASNKANSSQYTIYVDTLNATVTFNITNGSFFNTITPTINFTIVDNQSTSINYTLFIDGTANKTGFATNATVTSLTLDNINNGNNSYSLIIQTRDNATNTINSSSFVIYVDTTNPTAGLNYPMNGLNISDWNMSFYFMANDSGSIALNSSCTLYTNLTGSWTANASNSSLNATFINFSNIHFSNGTYLWNVLCADVAGNIDWGDNNYTFTVDTIAPNVSSIITPISGANISATQLLNVTIADLGISGIKIVYAYLQNGSSNINITQIFLDTSNYYNYTFSFTGLANGNYNITVNASDQAGNINRSKYAAVTFDDVAPKLATSGYINATNVSQGGSFPINVTLTDATTGVSSATCSVTIGGTSATNTLTVVNGITCNGTITVPGIVPAGNQTLNITVTDYAGNIGYNDTWQVSVLGETTLPLVNYTNGPTVNGSVVKTGDTIVVAAWASDAGSGLGTNNCTIFIGTTMTNESITQTGGWCNSSSVYIPPGPVDGVQIINVTINDTALNTGYNNTYVVVVDNTAPNLTVITANFSNFTTTVNISGNASDAHSAVIIVNNTNFGTNQGTFTSWSFNSTGLANGLYDLSFTINDTKNNQNTTIIRIRVDTSGPQVVINSPPNTSYVKGVINLSATITETSMNTSNVRFRYYNSTGGGNYGNWNDMSNSTTLGGITQYNGSFNTASIADGTYIFQFSANDTLDNKNESENLTLIIDNTVPTINTALNWTYDEANKLLVLYFSEIINISSFVQTSFGFTNADGTGSFNLSSGTYSATSNTSTVNITLTNSDHTSLKNLNAPRKMNVAANAVADRAGNNIAAANNVTASTYTASDTTAPQITASAPSGTVTTNEVSINVTTDENASCRYASSDQAYSTMTAMTTNSTGLKHNATLASLNDSTYTYYVRCNDTFGNVMQVSSIIAFIRDTTGNFNYTQSLNKNWNTLWIPHTSILESMGMNISDRANVLNISNFLITKANLATNYNTVYYNINGTSTGWVTFIQSNWAGSTLQWINNTNDRPYWINMSVADRFEI